MPMVQFYSLLKTYNNPLAINIAAYVFSGTSVIRGQKSYDFVPFYDLENPLQKAVNQEIHRKEFQFINI